MKYTDIELIHCIGFWIYNVNLGDSEVFLIELVSSYMSH